MELHEYQAAIWLVQDTLRFYAAGGGDGGARARSTLAAEIQEELERMRKLERVAKTAQAFMECWGGKLQERLMTASHAYNEYLALDAALNELEEAVGRDG